MIAAILAFLCATVQESRTPWTSSRVHGSPEEPPPYRTEPVFPKLRFAFPVDLVAVPGTDLLAVAELRGKIRVFENRPEVEEASAMFDVEGCILGITFHPRFSENPFLYAVVALQDTPFVELIRFTVVGRKADPRSGLVLLRWPFTQLFTRLGGSVRFGPDGFLYVGVGDGTDGIGPRDTGQDLSDFESSILRIDVDHPPPSRRYAIPRDNPFVGIAGARPEIWAFGLRNPWKMSFDGPTGDLWVGDVGESSWESVLRVRRGGNYGWSVQEGGHPAHPGRVSERSPISPPVVVHPHTEFRAVVGGLVYRGSRLPELAGSYVYGDYDTGRIWEVRLDGEQVVRHRELSSSPLRVIGFAEDARRELLILSVGGGTIHRLVPNAGAVRNADFPRTLAETGLFASVRDHRPADGVVPYTVTAALWSDGADKDRFIALPGTSRIRPDRIFNHYAKARQSETWDFPDGTVLVKTFSIGGRRIETRLLHLEKKADTGSIQDQLWRGYSYRWRADQTEADLVGAAGLDAEVTGTTGRQTWRFPSRSECLQCHSMPAHFILGVNTLQMNRDIEVPGRGKVNQLEWLRSLGLFEGAGKPVSALPRLAGTDDAREDLGRRARAYLQANCAHCHVFLGGGNAAFEVHANRPLEETGLVDVPPLHGSLGLPDARLVAPGNPERSMILHRMGLHGTGRMPPLASNVVDEEGMKLLSAWIRQMPPVPRQGGRTWAAWAAASAAAVLLAGLAAWRLSERRCRSARSTGPRTGAPPTP